MKPHWHLIRILFWAIPIAYELAIEFYAIANPNYPTLTSILRWIIPIWVRWMILGWLIYHFGVAPANYSR